MILLHKLITEPARNNAVRKVECVRMKILVTGSICSGKSTLARELTERLPHAELVPDHCKELLSEVPVIDWTMSEIRSYLIVNQLLMERRKAVLSATVIVDGGVISNIAHDRLLLTEPLSRGSIMQLIGHEKYDLVIYCDYKEIPLVDDGMRHLDHSLRDDLAKEIIMVIGEMGNDEFHFARGSVFERVEDVISLVSSLG